MSEDNDLLICELQHDLDEYKKDIENLKSIIDKLIKANKKLHELLAMAKDPTHNPASLSKDLMEVENEWNVRRRNG